MNWNLNQMRTKSRHSLSGGGPKLASVEHNRRSWLGLGKARVFAWTVTLVSLVVLAFSVHWTDQKKMAGAPPAPGVISLIQNAKTAWLALAIGVAFCSACCLVTRWFLLLAAGPSRLSLRWCARVWAESQVLCLLPTGQIGGDAYRISRAWHHSSAAWPLLAGGIERITGLLALVVVAGVGLAIQAGYSSGAAFGMAATGLCAFFGIGAAISACLNSGPATKVGENEHVKALLSQVGLLLNRPVTLISTILLSLAVQSLAPLSFIAADRAMGFSTDAQCYLIAVPAVTLLQFLPIHIAGIGVLEGGLWAVLHRISGRSITEVLAICALVRAVGLVFFVILVVALIVSRMGSVPRRNTLQVELATAV